MPSAMLHGGGLVICRCVCMCLQSLPTELGLLQPVVDVLGDWCRVLTSFPVVTWSSFVDYVRARVNLLATEEHCRELVHQLAVIGEASIAESLLCVS